MQKWAHLPEEDQKAAVVLIKDQRCLSNGKGTRPAASVGFMPSHGGTPSLAKNQLAKTSENRWRFARGLFGYNR